MLLLAGAALVAGCGAGGPPGSTGEATAVGDPGPVHVHGLGVNPKDGALFIATHTGLFRAPEGSPKATRVGDRYQDTMGFSVVGPDRFLGSGHPDGRDDLPPFLGLIRSNDAGRSWDPVSLLGKADFHVLEASGARVYGFGTDFDERRPRFMVSDDGGRSWVERDVPAPLVALAIDPRDADAVVASDGSKLYRSTTGGRRWRGRPGPGGLTAWTEGGELTVVTAAGEVAAAPARQRSWSKRGDIGGQPAAFESAGDELLVALHDGTIKRSRDGGRTWEVRSRP